MDEEKVEYSFTGDVSSLKKTTKKAISLLDEYEGTVKDLAKSDGLNVGKTAFAGFQKTVNGVIKQVNSLSGLLSTASRETQEALVPNTPAVEAAYTSIANALQFLKESSSVTSDDLKLVTMELKDAQTILDPLAVKITALGSSFQKVAQLSEQSMTQISASTGNSTQKTAAQVETLGQKWDNYTRRMSKSAEMSAKVFEDAGKFTKLSTAVDTITTKAILMKSRVTESVSKISDRFKTMASSAISPVTAKIQSLKDKAASAGNRITQAFSTVTAAFRRTNKSTVEGARVMSSYRETADRTRASLNNVSGAANFFASAMNGVKNAAGGISDAFFSFAGVQVGDILSDGAKGAIDYVENLNLFQVAMGGSVDKGKEFVAQMQEVYGMDPSNVHRYAGYFYQLTDAIGMNEDASATMSLSMTKAANDLASLFNTDVQTVVEDLASGMQGMSRSVRKYGMDIRTTTLEQTALKYGLEGNVETMSEADRQALRYITMLDQAQNALHQTTTAADGTSSELGDFARNIESPANQLRIFKEQMAQLGRAIGNFIVAPLQKALPYINGFVMALRTAVNFLGSIAGVAVQAGSSLDSAGNSAGDAAEGVSAIGDEATDATKKLKQLIAPFDELNVLQTSSDSDSELVSDDALNPALAQALSNMSLDLEDISMKANQVRDDILGILGLTVTTDPITGEQIIQWDKGAFQEGVMKGLNDFKEWFTNLSPLVQGAIIIAGVVASIGTIIGVVSAAIGALPTLVGALEVLGLAFSILTNPIFLVIAAMTALLIFSEDFRTAFIGLFTEVGDSFKEWGSILGEVFTTVGTDLVSMWDTHILPTIEAIGTLLAPALGTLGSLWENLSTIIGGIFVLIGELWTNLLKPVIEGALDIIGDLCNIFRILWEEFVGPILEEIGTGIENLWVNYLQPIISKIISIVGDIIDIIMVLWNILAPLVTFLVDVLAPVVKGVFQAIWGVIEFVVGLILAIIDTLLGVFAGLTQFLAGVFTLDWKRALSGLLNIFVALGNGIVGIIESVVNLCISIINAFLSAILGAIKGILNGLGDVIEAIAEVMGYNIDLTIRGSVPQIPKQSWGRIPKVALATGGVVTGPTHALIGEGKYSEAVIPLDDSPQMNDLINKIVDAINKNDNSNSQPVEVKVYIGDKEYDAYTYKASERGKRIVGRQPVKIGG